MRRPPVALGALVGVAVLAGGRPAVADGVCASASGPVELSLRDAGLAAPRRPCVERRVSLHLRGAALLDLPAFYGTLGASGQLGLRLPAAGLEWSASARVLDWRFAQNASIAADETGLGPLSVGVLFPIATGDTALAPSLRLTLPFTDSAYSRPYSALEAAVHAGHRLHRRVDLFAAVTVFAWAVAPPDALDARAAANLHTTADYTPWPWLHLHAGLEVQTGWYGLALDHLAARAGLRIATPDVLIDLGAVAPLAGRDRTTLAAVLGVTLPFERP